LVPIDTVPVAVIVVAPAGAVGTGVVVTYGAAVATGALVDFAASRTPGATGATAVGTPALEGGGIFAGAGDSPLVTYGDGATLGAFVASRGAMAPPEPVAGAASVYARGAE
jgi:hypothetical protein